MHRIRTSLMMECNKDEAVRSREIAEKNFLAKDIVGAKKYAIKAQKLYPDLDGISQLISVLDVHLSAETLVNGERDWYEILSLGVTADEEAVKKQYRKLALMFHPDKNKCVGAEGAFKAISEAWSVLSDKNARVAYDKKRNINVTHCPHGSEGFYNFANRASVRIHRNTARHHEVHRNTARHHASPSSFPTPNPPPKSTTFWTSCMNCKMQYEYPRVYLNHKLVCPSCHEPFLAVETGHLTNEHHNYFGQPSGCQKQKLNRNCSHGHKRSVTSGKGTTFQHDLDAFSNSSFYWGAFSRMAGAASATASFTAAARAAKLVHQTYEKVKREREEKQAAGRRNEVTQKKINVSNDRGSTTYCNVTSIGSISDRRCHETSNEERSSKKRRSISEDFLNYNGNMVPERRNISNRNKENSGKTAFEMEKGNDIFVDSKNRTSHGHAKSLNKEISHLNIQNMLIQKSKLLIQKNLEYLTSSGASKSVNKQKNRNLSKIKRKKEQ